MDWKTIILIITLVANFFLAFLSYFGSKNEKVNIIWSAAVSAVFFWVFAMIFYRNAGSENALVWCRVLYISATLIPILFLYFTFFYPEGKWLINKKVGFLITLPTFAIILLVILPNIIIKDVMIKPGQEKEIIFGPYYFLYALYISGYFFWSILNLCKKYFKYYGIIKSQIRYILLGTLISIILGSTFNLLMPWFGEFRFNWLGQVTTLFMVSSVSYAIVKRELFGIKLVLVQILVVVIAILLLFQFLASTTFFEYAWKGALLIVFLIFGWLLINSVLKEIKHREELQKAYAEVERLSKAKSEFISIASHQLRTPLTAIKGYISMIMEGDYGSIVEEARKPMENVYKSNERLIKLVNDLLSVSRIEAGKIELELQKSSIEEIISNIISVLKIEAEKKNLYLKWEKPAEPLPKILIDQEKVRQVILNIVDNAIKYTNKGGVTINTEIKDSNCQIKVSDTGEGMEKEEINYLFESFTRGKVGVQFHTEGAGLGLYIARKFVEMHQGKIWAESAGKGKGSTFYIELPIK